MHSIVSTDRSLPCTLGVQELAKILKISKRSVWRYVASGELPQPIRFGRNVRWRLEDVEAWIEARISPHRNGGPRRPR